MATRNCDNGALVTSLAAVWLSLAPAGARADTEAAAAPPPVDGAAGDAICLIIASAAQANGIPTEYFARVIWQESRFQSDAVGPRTRNGQRAIGIAQFMPGTAAERGLLDPFNPVLALPKAAEYLRELRAEFGNLGLAAAAYNAGPQRVRNFLEGRGGMPNETRAYVSAITGATVEDWSRGGDAPRPAKSDYSCPQLMALLRRSPNPFIGELERRVKNSVSSPWGVQLSAGFSRDRALASYARIAGRQTALLEGRDPLILAGRLRSRGTHLFYQVRIGLDTRGEAERLCTRIRGAGEACLVLRNRA